MANLCKFDKKQYQVSYDSGVTWANVIPEQISKGDNMIEYDSQDCTSIDTMYRWRTLDGQYLCDDKEKWTKEIQEESYNNGLTWYASYPTVYRKGTYVGIDEAFCNDKFVGHYVATRDSSSKCPQRYAWNGYRCVVYADPLKIVKCNDSTTLTQYEVRYFRDGFWLSTGEIGDCVTSIDYQAFDSCISLTSIDIPNSVTSIGSSAFQHCTSLTSCTIGSGITTIGDYAFQNCTNLTSITVNALTPPTLGSIYVFQNTNSAPIFVPCESVDRYRTASGWSSYASRIQAILNTCTGATKFSAAYSGGQTYSAACDSSTELTTNDTKPSGYQYSSMTSATVGDCVTSIGYQAFSNCRSLSSVTVNATTPPTLGIDVFYKTTCPIYVPCQSLFDYRSAWSSYASRIQAIPPCEPTPTGATKVYSTYNNGEIYFKYCDSSTELSANETRPSGYQYSRMTSATVGDCVTSIGKGAFQNCSGLTSITIPSSVTSIGWDAFYGCTSLSSITIPNSVTSIGGYAFYGCSSLTSIDIPSSVTSLGNGVFWNCNSLTSITVHAATPPSLDYDVFGKTNNCPIYVPAASVDAYKSSWSSYASRIQAIPT